MIIPHFSILVNIIEAADISGRNSSFGDDIASGIVHFANYNRAITINADYGTDVTIATTAVRSLEYGADAGGFANAAIGVIAVPSIGVASFVAEGAKGFWIGSAPVPSVPSTPTWHAWIGIGVGIPAIVEVARDDFDIFALTSGAEG